MRRLEPGQGALGCSRFGKQGEPLTLPLEAGLGRRLRRCLLLQSPFSPFRSQESGGQSFEDTGGSLELFRVKSSEPDLLSRIATSARFAAVAWTPFSDKGRYPLGLVAGGMVDGHVQLWDVQKLIDQPEQALVASQKLHSAVSALQFSTLEPHRLATGGTEGDVFLIDCHSPSQSPQTIGKKSAEITAIAWNTQVAHIVATATTASVTVWDLKAAKSWCDLRATGTLDLLWNPREGLHLLTAGGTQLAVWDLGASTTMPLAQLQGHAGDILAVAWCPHDDTLLMTCAKDNRTLLWDLLTLQPVAELPQENTASASGTQQSSQALFAQPTEQKSLRYALAWSPFQRGVVLTCSLDRLVEVHSILALATQAGRPPKWMKPSGSVSTAFGAMLIHTTTDNRVVVSAVPEQEALVRASMSTEKALETDRAAFMSQAQTKGAYEEQLWGFLQVLFQPESRQALLQYLGLDSEAIAEAAKGSELNGSSSSLNLPTPPPPPPANKGSKKSGRVSSLVKKALMVGDFASAVECCWNAEQFADALMLAAVGGGDLWQATQERYLQQHESSYMKIVNAVLKSDLASFVSESEPSQWQETLAILSTYATSQDFPELCIALGDRLDGAGNAAHASLCYLCSLNVEKSVRYWMQQLDLANEKLGRVSLLALHEFCVKATILMEAVGPSVELPESVAVLFSQYAEALSEQGLLVSASKYLKGTKDVNPLLKDRLYRSRSSGACLQNLGQPPAFPFTMVDITQSRGQTNAAADRRARDEAAIAQKQQQEAYAAQQKAYEAQQQVYAQQTQQHVYEQPAPSTTVSAALPAGWIELQDPSSGQLYYANQATGETTWERPKVAQSVSTTMDSSRHSTASSTKNTLASKYGDGFVTSASNPELASQYGNVGTSNPYSGADRPGTAAAAIGSPQGKAAAPVSATFNIETLELSAELVPTRDAFLSIISSLQSVQLSPADKRQLSEAEKGVAILVKKLARGDLDDSIVSSINYLVGAVCNHDYASAMATQTALVNSDWRTQKDWLKGLKLLIQLIQRKF